MSMVRINFAAGFVSVHSLRSKTASVGRHIEIGASRQADPLEELLAPKGGFNVMDETTD